MFFGNAAFAYRLGISILYSIGKRYIKKWDKQRLSCTICPTNIDDFKMKQSSHKIESVSQVDS